MDRTQEADLHALKERARRLRLDVLDMTAQYGGHVSSCFSATEIVTALLHARLRHVRLLSMPGILSP